VARATANKDIAVSLKGVPLKIIQMTFASAASTPIGIGDLEDVLDTQGRILDQYSLRKNAFHRVSISCKLIHSVVRAFVGIGIDTCTGLLLELPLVQGHFSRLLFKAWIIE
jgi:hypothetical protein